MAHLRHTACPTIAINTFHSYDLYILNRQSSGGHTSKSLNHYLRQGSLFCCLLPGSNYTSSLRKRRKNSDTLAHSRAAENAHTSLDVGSGSCSP